MSLIIICYNWGNIGQKAHRHQTVALSLKFAFFILNQCHYSTIDFSYVHIFDHINLFHWIQFIWNWLDKTDYPHTDQRGGRSVAWPAVGHWCPDRPPGTHDFCILIMIKTLSVSMASILNVVPVVITWHMMTSSNGIIFRVTGHLCGEFTGPRWIPRTKASDTELWCFLWSAPE